jgi:osmotically-inducible protein OsmY
VTSVVDNINVGGRTAPTTGDTIDNMSGAAREAGRDMGDATREAGRDISDAARDAGAATSDAAVTTAVKTKFLADPDVSGLAIDVDTSNGVVTLSGTVPTRAEKDEALRLARETTGVTRVNDKLTVGR